MSSLTKIERATLALVATLTVLAGVGRYAHGFSTTAAFILAALALAGQAWMVGFSTEQIGKRFGPGVTGTMQATVGNLPEFFVVIFALQAKDTTVAETAILGSILVNALLVLGLVLVAGSIRAEDGIMRFSPRLPNDAATLTLAASLVIVLIGVVHFSHNHADLHTRAISVVGAIVLLIVYGTWMRQFLRSDSGPAQEAHSPPRVPARDFHHVAGAGRCRVSVRLRLVCARARADDPLGPHLPGVCRTGDRRDRRQRGLKTSPGYIWPSKARATSRSQSSRARWAQLAAFLYPLLVLVSLLTASSLTFALAPVYVGALIGTAILVWQITGDGGKRRRFEGVALIAVYVVVAVIAAFEH